MYIDSIRQDLFLEIGGECFLTRKAYYGGVKGFSNQPRYLIGASGSKRSEVSEEYFFYSMTHPIHQK